MFFVVMNRRKRREFSSMRGPYVTVKAARESRKEWKSWFVHPSDHAWFIFSMKEED